MGLEVLCDLRSQFGPARDQGARPTCLAFATSDAHAALRPAWSPLSCEFVFYHAQRRAGRLPSSGAVLPAMLTALKMDGQPVESDWPYLDALPRELDAYGPPAQVAVYRRSGEPRHEGMDEVIARLDAGFASLLLMTISDAFYLPDGLGVVRAPPGEGPDPIRRHAVVAVGHGRVDGEPGLLVRNSWGDAWGLAGHAWLSKGFLAPRLTRVALLMEEVHVPAQDLAA